MALNIKNAEVERLASEMARLKGVTKTEAIRLALIEQRERLAVEGNGSRWERVQRLLQDEIWPSLPPEVRGTTLTKAERESILGYGPEGV